MEEENPKHVCRFIQLDKVDEAVGCEGALSSLYGIFGLSKAAVQQAQFNGTLFWFPLRKTPSDLSQNIYSEEKCLDLFRSFKHESPEMLLFFTSIEKIEIYKDEGHELQMEFFVGLSEENVLYESRDSIRQKRKLLRQKMEEMENRMTNDPSSISDVDPIEISYILPINLSSTCRTTQWLVLHYFHAGSVSQKMCDLITNSTSKYRPYMGTAAPIDDVSERGKVFCLLPLPTQDKSLTGLPVHVNGYLALDSNRNHIKRATQEQLAAGSHKDNDLVWNEMLLASVFPLVYTKFLEEIHRLSNSGNFKKRELLEFFYRCIPQRGIMEDQWADVMPVILKHILQTSLPCLQSLQWVKTEQSVFALFRSDTDPEIKRSVYELYKKCNTNVVHLNSNDHLYYELRNMYDGLQATSPADFRIFLRSHREYTEMKREDKLNFLLYVIQDEKLSDVKGLQLIPLLNGSFDCFKDITKGPSIFICRKNEDTILLDFKSTASIVSTNLPEFAFKAITRLQETGESC